jgi:C4-dicarboxylate transporter, DctM subunit
MTSIELGFWSIGGILLLIATRMPIGIALGAVGFLGITQLRGMDVAFGLIRNSPFEFSARWSLSAIPMFLLMGSIAYHSGISSALFRAARMGLSGVSGGLAVATNLACAVFAAASGSSVGTAAAMGRIAIPEMLKAGYDKGLATGVVASAGTLGSLIPPSILFLLYGVIAEVSVVKLMIAGILPGLLTAGIYTIMIIVRCNLNPELAPRPNSTEATFSKAEKKQALIDVWPILLLISGIIGGLYGGIVTPTEAGAGGAFLACVITTLQRRMNFDVLRNSLVEAISASARIFFVAVGAIMYSKFLALTGMPAFVGDLMGDWKLDPIMLVIGTSLIYVVLGMFLDPIGVLLLTLPILLPMFEALNLDLIWLGVLVVKYLEIGLLTPPVGLNVYVIKSVVGKEISLETIFKGVGWFLFCEVIIVVLLIAFPQISLFLPNTMN